MAGSECVDNKNIFTAEREQTLAHLGALIDQMNAEEVSTARRFCRVTARVGLANLSEEEMERLTPTLEVIRMFERLACVRSNEISARKIPDNIFVAEEEFPPDTVETS